MICRKRLLLGKYVLFCQRGVGHDGEHGSRVVMNGERGVVNWTSRDDVLVEPEPQPEPLPEPLSWEQVWSVAKHARKPVPAVPPPELSEEIRREISAVVDELKERDEQRKEKRRAELAAAAKEWRELMEALREIRRTAKASHHDIRPGAWMPLCVTDEDWPEESHVSWRMRDLADEDLLPVERRILKRYETEER